MIKTIYGKFIGGSVGNQNSVISTSYKYEDETFEYLGGSSLYDGGVKANKEGYYTFDSIKAFIESKGKDPLVLIEDQTRLS